MDNFQLRDNSTDINIGGQTFTVFPSRKLIAAIDSFTAAVSTLEKSGTIKNTVKEADAATDVIVSAIGEAKAREIFEIDTVNEDLMNLVGAAEYISNTVGGHILNLRDGLKKEDAPHIERTTNIPYVKRNRK